MVLMWAFMNPSTAHTYFENHASSELNPSFMDEYLAGEEATGWYSKGYQPEDLGAIIGPFHTLPLGLVPKLHLSKF